MVGSSGSSGSRSSTRAGDEGTRTLKVDVEGGVFICRGSGIGVNNRSLACWLAIRMRGSHVTSTGSGRKAGNQQASDREAWKHGSVLW